LGEAAANRLPVFLSTGERKEEMDLRQYYKKLHEAEAEMPESHVLVVSLETGDGGKAGVITETPRRNACQLILDGRARRASQEEEEAFRLDELDKREAFERAKTASRMQFQVVPRETARPTPVKREK
jgi:hypothetical protein